MGKVGWYDDNDDDDETAFLFVSLYILLHIYYNLLVALLFLKKYRKNL